MILFSQQETPNWLSTYASFNLPVYTLSPFPSPHLTSPFSRFFSFFPQRCSVLRLLSNLTSLSFHSQSYQLYYVSTHLRNPRAIFPSPANQLLLSFSIKIKSTGKGGGKIVRYSFKINLFRGVQFSIGTRISTRD